MTLPYLLTTDAYGMVDLAERLLTEEVERSVFSDAQRTAWDVYIQHSRRVFSGEDLAQLMELPPELNSSG
jgi:hypothetical protein